ncbi:MAG: sulfatase-like hydrolase/transferase [Clostridiales bacterium]|nr:sulfatase-like hydrolase/transferase [Clostridiales bacterium]
MDNREQQNQNKEKDKLTEHIEADLSHAAQQGEHVQTAKETEEALTAPKSKKKRKTVKDKLRALVKDKRSFRMRLLIAFLVSFAFAYTLTIFGPFELYLPNKNYYVFSFTDLVQPMVLIGVGLTLLLTVVLMLFKGKLFNYLSSALFAVTVSAYLQGNVLNPDLGTLDGRSIPWESMTISMLINVAVWAVIFIIPYVVAYLKPKLWRILLVFVSVLLIGMQSVALVTLIVRNDYLETVSDGYLSNDTIYEVSPKNNVVMFLLDRFDLKYAKEVFRQYPDIPESLNDFIFYDNVCGSYSRTFPSVTYLLTGVQTDYTMPVADYMQKAWTEGTFLQKIKDAGFESKIYTDVNYVMKDVEYAAGKIDNIKEYGKKTDKKKMVSAMLDLSAYRYSPLAMKPFFWLYTGELANISTVDAEAADMHVTDDAAFWANLKAQKLSVKEESNGSFIFYHMQGSHDPYVMDVDGSTPEGGTGGEGKWRPYRQTAGNLNMILDYIKYLKEMDLYEDTTIIITADHGDTGTLEELDYQRIISLMVKPGGANADVPIQYSSAPLSVKNIQATVLKSLGIDHEDYGPAIDEVAEDADVVRYFWMSGSDPFQTKRDYHLVTYEIRGDIKDFNNWKIVSKEKILYPYYDA